MIKQPDFVPGESVPDPPSREAEIAARLADAKDATRRANGVKIDDYYPGSAAVDVAYLLAQLQQARQELERLRPMAERYLDIKEGR